MYVTGSTLCRNHCRIWAIKLVCQGSFHETQQNNVDSEPQAKDSAYPQALSAALLALHVGVCGTPN